MSPAGSGSTPSGSSAQWQRLERAAQDASVVVASWKRRALEAEDEVLRLRKSLEDLAAEETSSDNTREEIRRLRAENSALHSRVVQAQKRVIAVLKRLDALGVSS